MLGGPQCGIIVGKKKYVERVKKNPLVRAFRCDKLTYSALEATLKLYLDEATLPQKLPILRMLTQTTAQIANKERSFLRKIKPYVEGKCTAKIMNGFSLMGSGSLPGRDIPTKLIALLPNVMTVEELAYKLRKNIPPIFTRIENEAVILDFRTVFEGEEKILVEAIRDIF
jgi:L-seryl-tRNA(Ser) seleniumtransferase